jgi:hypothetical protein
MQLINPTFPLRLSHLWLPAGQLQKGRTSLCSALLYSRLGGAQVARQRCPILHPDFCSISSYQPFQRGHLYFAENRTFLLCIDRLMLLYRAGGEGEQNKRRFHPHFPA